jgi:hypothetical protein
MLSRLFAAIPDPWRGWIGLRRARRWLRAVRFAQRHNAQLASGAPAVTFWPMRLEPTSAVAHVVARLGARIAPFGTDADLVFAWHTGTYLSPKDVARLPADALNRGCVDISKSTVDQAWAKAAGYSISVDPTTFEGRMVVKPEANGVRGGRIVNAPIGESKRGFVYQRLVDCQVGDRIETTRPMIFRGALLVVYQKSRAKDDWFAGIERVAVAAAADCFSAEEMDALLRFCTLIGMDYGELDVVRDSKSGLIYVVDANRTPIRPRGLLASDDDAAFEQLTAELHALLPVRAD